MRAVLAGAILALAVTVAEAAEGESNSANSLLPLCKGFLDATKRVNPSDAGYCAGLVDGLASLGRRVTVPCWNPPAKSTVGERVRVVVRYIEAHPQKAHELFVDLAIEALHEEWPCKP
jgi:hypothetical protein